MLRKHLIFLMQKISWENNRAFYCFNALSQSFSKWIIIIKSTLNCAGKFKNLQSLLLKINHMLWCIPKIVILLAHPPCVFLSYSFVDFLNNPPHFNAGHDFEPRGWHESFIYLTCWYSTCVDFLCCSPSI